MRTSQTVALPLALVFAALGSTLAAQEDEKLTIPEREDITLRTKDFVQLQCSMYPGGFLKRGDEVEKIDGKTVVPIILVHGWGEKRQDLSLLAAGLQSIGHAVIVPDLRGHGRSTKRVSPAGVEIDLDAEKFRRNDIIAMVEDLASCKRHLLELNNKGELNIEQLTVVGSDVGAMTALNYIAYDWSRPTLPTIKQGHDVKAFVLLTPLLSFKGATCNQSIRHPALTGAGGFALDGLLFVGARDTKNLSDARRIFKQLASGRDDPPKDLYLLEPDTTLSGTRLITARGLGVASNIAKFIDAKIVRKQDDYRWRDRTSVLAD